MMVTLLFIALLYVFGMSWFVFAFFGVLNRLCSAIVALTGIFYALFQQKRVCFVYLMYLASKGSFFQNLF